MVPLLEERLQAAPHTCGPFPILPLALESTECCWAGLTHKDGDHQSSQAVTRTQIHTCIAHSSVYISHEPQQALWLALSIFWVQPALGMQALHCLIAGHKKKEQQQQQACRGKKVV